MPERFVWTHELSKEWRRKLNYTIEEKLRLDPTILQTSGIITRIYDGQLIYEKSGTSLEWKPTGHQLRSPRYRETPIVVHVKSQEEKDIDFYTVLVTLSALSDTEKLEDLLMTPEDKRKLILEINGTTGHSCRDELYNAGLKKIPTICKHRVASVFHVQENISKSIEDERLQNDIKFFRFYEPLPQEFTDFYNSLPADMKSIERTEALYRFLKGEYPVFNV